jgi:hypothetical protein
MFLYDISDIRDSVKFLYEVIKNGGFVAMNTISRRSVSN